MKRNVVLRVSARLAASLAVLLLLLVPALAGDRALINILGYSPDGRYFAFEQFGEHDGSGGVYSSVEVIDLSTDKWLYGSPFTIDEGGDTEETPPLAEVRAKALAKAKDKLDELEINEPIEYLYLLGEGQSSDKGKVATFSTPACCQPGATQDDAFTLVLSTVYAKSKDAACEGIDTLGYVLMLQDAQGKHVLHDDGQSVPSSRGCPLDYRLYAVVQPMDFAPRVAIVSVYPMGFEGPDRRFIAVPIDKP